MSRWLAMTALWLGGCVAGLAESEEERPGSALDDSAFEFCHRPQDIRPEVWCRLIEDVPQDRCSGMREACAALARGEPLEQPASGCNRDAASPETNEASAPSPRSTPESFEWSSGAVDELLQWLAAFGVAALVLVLLRVFMVTFGRFRARTRKPADEAPPPPSLAADEPADDALPDVPALTSAALIDQAEAAFAAGRFGEAAWLARGAALKHLHRRELVRLHRSRTDREYLRAVRRRPEVEGDLRTVVGAAERHRWGAEDVRSEQASDALVAARRLLAVAAAVVLTLLVVPTTALAQADRFTPQGDAGLARVLVMHGYDAGYRLVSIDQLNHEIDALFLDLSRVDLDAAHWSSIRDWVDDGGVLVAAGDVTIGFESFGDWVALPPDVPLTARSPLSGTDTPLPRWPDGPRAAFSLGQPWVEADVDGLAYPVVSEVVYGAGVVIGIADDRLFRNVAFVHPDNEAFMGDLLFLGQAHLGWPLPTPARVQLVTQAALSSGSSPPTNNPIASLSNAELLPFVLQLLATWTLLALWRGWPMGRPRDAKHRERLSFGEHITALGTRWFRQRASGHALREVARLWLARLGAAGLLLAARRSGYDDASAKAFVQRVTEAAEQESPEPSADDLERMEEIWTITRRTT